MTPFSFTRRNRSPKTIGILIAVYAGLLGLILLFDAAWWLVALPALAALPAVWDVVQNSSAGLKLDRDHLCWHSGRREGELPLQDIDFFRFDTRWDFSVRVSAILTSKKRVRLPDESVPPHRQFEEVLKQAGFRVERHHFTIF